ncbi:YggT family protein [Candidatus Saccharibacteria bacterium]|nr:YggT family protein [Candidatus Saccharibacteria bacterium]
MNPYQTKKVEAEEIPVPTKFKVSKFITWAMYAWAIFGVMILLLRTFLLATSANLEAGFSSFVIRTSSDYLQPFRGIFSPAELSDTGYLDISSIFAAITYLFLGWGVKELINYIQDRIDRYRNLEAQKLMRQAVASANETE